MFFDFFQRPEHSRLIKSKDDFFESIDPLAHVGLRNSSGQIDKYLFVTVNSTNDDEMKFV